LKQNQNPAQFPRNFGLKLIASDGNCVYSLARPNLDPDILLRRAASGMECINVARQVLRIKLTASPVEIAEAVALELGNAGPYSK